MRKYLAGGYAIDEGRLIKAKKIEKVLLDYFQTEQNCIFGKKIVDIGCGSGQIAWYFSKQNDVTAADIINQLSTDVRDQSKFQLLAEDHFPFSPDEFDVVILNHVLAHVKNKLKFLQEIFRITKKNGICYIANPNRIFPIEPYYRVPLLHYLPQKMFLKLAKYSGRKKEDVYLISYPSLKKLAQRTGFEIHDFTIKLINTPDRYGSEFKLPLRLPQVATIISPTNIFVLKKIG